jgi:hypothetical protein
MSSRALRILILGFLAMGLVSSLVGCDRFLKSSQDDKEKAQLDTVQLKLEGLDCLKVLPTQITAYTNDQASAEDVDAIYTCVEKSVNKFTLYTRGKDENSYSGDDLRYFLNRYLLKENQITEGLMKQLLKLKVFLIGGSETVFTRTEITDALAYARVLRDEAKILRGHLRLLLFRDEKSKISADDLESLRKVVKATAMKLVDQSHVTGSMYEFEDFKDLLKEVHGFLNTNSEFLKFEKYIPLAQAGKDLLIGERAQLETQRDWKALLDWGVDGYFVALTAFSRWKAWDFNTVATSRELTTVLLRGLDVIGRAPIYKTLGRLDAAAIDKVLDEAHAQDLFMTKVPVEVIKAAYRRLIVRVLDRNSADDVRLEDVTGLEKKHLAVLHFEMRAWELAQEHLSEAFAAPGVPAEGLTPARLLDAVKAEDIPGKIQNWKDITDVPGLQRTWQDWNLALSQPRPVQWTLSGRIRLEPDAAATPSSLKGLTIMNGLRSAVRLLLRGYGEGTSANLWDLRLQEKDLIKLEKDFHEFAVAVKFIDPRSANPAGRTFKEASFFSYSGNGDDWLTSQETFEELNTLVAAGNNVGAKVFEEAKAAHCALTDIKADVFDLPMIDEACFEKVMRDGFAKDMAGLPKLAAEVARMDEKQWDEFFKNVMSVASVSGKKPGMTEYSEIRTMFVVLHYVEGLIQIYDINHDDRLQQSEIQAAAPRFHSFIAAQSPLGDNFVDTIFMYIVYKGQKPGTSDIGHLFGFQFEMKRGLGDIGRQQLMRVLAVLKEDASK